MIHSGDIKTRQVHNGQPHQCLYCKINLQHFQNSKWSLRHLMPPLGPPRMGECRDGREGSRKVRCPSANRTMDVQKRSLHSPFCFPTCKVARGSCFSENGFVHTEFLLAQGLLSYKNQEYKRPAVGLFFSSYLCAVFFFISFLQALLLRASACVPTRHQLDLGPTIDVTIKTTVRRVCYTRWQRLTEESVLIVFLLL